MSRPSARRVAEPVDPAGPAAVPERGHHRRVHLAALEHEHQRGRGAGDSAGQPVVQADAAEPAQPAAGADQVEGRDPAAEPLERAPAEAGVGVQRVVERADEKDAGIGETVWTRNPKLAESGARLQPGAQASAASDGLLIAELQIVQPAVEAAGAEQLRRGSRAARPGRRRARRSRRRPARWRAGGRSPAPSAPPSAGRSPAGPAAPTRCRARSSPRRGSGSADRAAAPGRWRSAAAVRPRAGCRARPARSRIPAAAAR